MPSFSDPIVCCALYFLWWWNGCLLFRLLACMPRKHWCASALLALCLLLLDPRCTFLLFRKYPEPCFSLPKASCRLSVPLFFCQCFVLVLQYEGLLLFSVNNCSSVVVKSVQRCWTCRLLAVVWCEHCFSVSLVYSNQVPFLIVLPIVVVSSLLYTWSCRCKANHCCLSFWCVYDDQVVALFKGCEFQVHV